MQYYVAAGGHLDIIQELLDHGCDPNEGYPPPIVWAVDPKHEAMFRLLVEHGADVKLPSARQDIVVQAKRAGLDSMLAMLASEGIAVDIVGTPSSRASKLCVRCEDSETEV
jgi:ankyrin repeat protein